MVEPSSGDLPARREVNEAIARALVLSDLGKFELLDVLLSDLSVELDETSRAQRLVLERKEALEAMLVVSEYLGLPADQAPTSSQFNQGAGELELDWNSARVIRLWERWTLAQSAFKGERRINSPVSRRLRQHWGRYRADHEDYLRGVKGWLRSHPETETKSAYDDYAEIFNATKATDKKPVVRAATIQRDLRLHWPSVLAVARGSLSIREARQAELAELLPAKSSDAILGLAGVVRMLNRSQDAVKRLADESPQFPTPVAHVRQHRAWLYEDLKLYKRGFASPRRVEDELQYLYLDALELQARLDLRPLRFKALLHSQHWDQIPRPDGAISRGVPYWKRAKVNSWLEAKQAAEQERAEQEAHAKQEAEERATAKVRAEQEAREAAKEEARAQQEAEERAQRKAAAKAKSEQEAREAELKQKEENARRAASLRASLKAVKAPYVPRRRGNREPKDQQDN